MAVRPWHEAGSTGAKILAILAAASMIGALVAMSGCVNLFDLRQHQGQEQTTGPTAIPTPSPSPTASPGVAGCSTPTRVALGIAGCSSGVAVNGVCGPINLTPFIGTVESPAQCDNVREVVWTTSPSSACRVEVPDNPYTPDVRGLAVGDCTIQATVDRVPTASIVVRVR